MPDDDVDVTWEVSDIARVRRRSRASGVETATAAHGHTVHAVVPLDQGDWYYRFRVGRLHEPGGYDPRRSRCERRLSPRRRSPSRSCQNYADGQYAAHRDLAEHDTRLRRLARRLHLRGSRASPERRSQPRACTSGPSRPRSTTTAIAMRRYKTDPHLQAAHRACPWFVIWDDHEVENNYAGARSAGPQPTQPTFADRRFAAYQAWWEHQPVRLDPPVAADEEYRIYREVHWGELIDLALLDGRQYRSDQACGDVTLSLEPPCRGGCRPGTDDAGR